MGKREDGEEERGRRRRRRRRLALCESNWENWEILGEHGGVRNASCALRRSTWVPYATVFQRRQTATRLEKTLGARHSIFSWRRIRPCHDKHGGKASRLY